TQQRPNLLAQHGWPVERDADGAPSHRRIFLLGVWQIGQYLVAADIERAKRHRPVAGMIEDAAVELGLLVDIGKAVLHHERDLGAVKSDPGRPRLVEIRQIDEQPGIEMQRHRHAVEGLRRRLANLGVFLLLRQAHLDIRLDGFLDVLAGRTKTWSWSPSTTTRSPASTLASTSLTRPTTGMSRARATMATCAVGEPSSRTSPLSRFRS